MCGCGKRDIRRRRAVKKIRFGVDLGGTKCSAVAADENLNILKKTVFQTGKDTRPQILLDELIKCFRKYEQELGENSNIVSIGISCGGPLDEEQGRILCPPNLPLWDDIPIVGILQDALHIPTAISNDADACALAEWRFGAGQGTSDMVFLTFGTGMGAGLILGGKLYKGSKGKAGEVGHIRLSESGPVGYGKRGSFEGYCSGGGIASLAEMMLGKKVSAKKLCSMADKGDVEAEQILRTSAGYLGRGLAVLIDILNPEMVVIGSIYQRATWHFETEMRRTLHEEALSGNLRTCRIEPAALGDRLGDIASLTVGMDFC